MTNELFSTCADAGRRSMENLQKLGEIHARTLGRMGEIQVNLASLGIEGSVEQAKLLMGGADYRNPAAAGTEFTRDFTGKLMELGRAAADAAAESRAEYLAWAAETMSIVPMPAPKPAKPKKRAESGESKAPARRSSSKQAA